MKLEIGSREPGEGGWKTVDVRGKPDVLYDLNCYPWPFADGCVERIVIKQTLEHLADK